MLAEKRITMGVTGGIAVYKAAQLASSLHSAGVDVHVIMTRAAQEFVSPMTFQVLSGNPVHTELFSPFSGSGTVRHVDLATRYDLVVVVPATANIIGKVAAGICDDLLSTVLMAATCPVLFCPAMNVNMYHNSVVQRNMATLHELGYHFVEPGEGRLACGAKGRGRLADQDLILSKIELLLSGNQAGDMAGLAVLVTAGPTVEPIDPVRYLTNRSSGKMGYAVAGVAARRGAEVILVSGPTGLQPPPGVKVVPVETAREMYQAAMEYYPDVHAVIKTAAVADYRPREISGHKLKKDQPVMTVVLEKNPDILSEMGRLKKGQTLVGFAAETQDLEQNALLKLANKNLDLLVANDVTMAGAGFGLDTNIVKLVYPGGAVTTLPLMSKQDLAGRILDEVLRLRKDDMT